MKYINTDKMIAEIERRIEETKSMKPSFDQFWAGQISAFKGVRTIIASLQQEQPAMIQWTGNNLKEVIDFTGKSKKFGEWFKSWEDFENYVHNHDNIVKLFCEDGSHYEVQVGAWIVKTPDGYNTPSRFRFIQKPAEWSEEDERNLYNIIEAIKYVFDVSEDSNGSRLITWIKHLRPQPHWKPSKDEITAIEVALKFLLAHTSDEQLRKNAISVIDHLELL